MKLRRFNVGDLVLRKVTPATNDLALGKLGPSWEGPYKVVHYSRQGNYHLEDSEGKKLPRPWNVEHLKRYYERNHSLIVKPNLILPVLCKRLFRIHYVLFNS